MLFRSVASAAAERPVRRAISPGCGVTTVMEEIERKVRAYYHLDGTEPEDEKKSDLKLTAEKKTDKEKTDAEQAE